jgi:serine/threonine protein kinase
MELCDKTLHAVLDEINKDSNMKVNGVYTPIGYHIVSQLFIEIIECVQYIHKHNIIHRDLTPFNILLKRQETYAEFGTKVRSIKICDFGLMAVHEFSEVCHSTDRGHVQYMAPEVNGGQYNTKADIYSLGCILKGLLDFDTYK